jgi:hypothetical protein
MTKTTKVWHLAVNNLDASDIVWLEGLGVNVEIENLNRTVVQDGKKVIYAYGVTIDVTTTCDEQETLLQLKYGNLLFLKSMNTEHLV